MDGPLRMYAPPSLTFVCSHVSASLCCLAVRWSGCLLIVGTNDIPPMLWTQLHFGCTAADDPLITLHAADWADNLGQSHQALEATLGAHTLITPLDLTRSCIIIVSKFRNQIQDLVRHDNFIWVRGKATLYVRKGVDKMYTVLQVEGV